MAAQESTIRPSRSALRPALAAPRLEVRLPNAGQVAYYADTAATGRPLLLIHSVNAAPSAMEMKPLFEHYRSSRPVYAPDLPGFGASERGDRPYSPEFFAETLLAFIDAVLEEPPDVVALSLGAEFAARALVRAPDKAASLALISPTGLGSRRTPSGRASDRLERAFRLPGTGALFLALTSRPSIRHFLNMAFEGAAPREMIDYAHATARQPGAKYAPFRFLSFRLFTPGALEELYLKVPHPTLVLYDRDPNVSFERLDDLLQRRANCRALRIAPTRGLPHWERLDETARALDDFWNGLHEKQASPSHMPSNETSA